MVSRSTGGCASVVYRRNAQVHPTFKQREKVPWVVLFTHGLVKLPSKSKGCPMACLCHGKLVTSSQDVFPSVVGAYVCVMMERDR